MTQALPTKIAQLLDAAATRHGVEPALVRAIAWCESKGDPRALSPKGAIGVMQLMPATVAEFQVADPYDAKQNIEGGVSYVARLLRLYGEVPGLPAYNAGVSKVFGKTREQWPQETRTWFDCVQTRRKLEPLTAADDVAPSVRLELSLQLGAFLAASFFAAAIAWSWSHKGGHA